MKFKELARTLFLGAIVAALGYHAYNKIEDIYEYAKLEQYLEKNKYHKKSNQKNLESKVASKINSRPKKINWLLQREEFTKRATYGTLYLDKNNNGVVDKSDEALVKTLELPYRENKRNISSIPLGDYDVEKWSSPRFPRAFHIKNVPDRSYILFHGKKHFYGTKEEIKDEKSRLGPKNTEGCVIVGTKINKGYIENVNTAMYKLLNRFYGKPIHLKILKK